MYFFWNFYNRNTFQNIVKVFFELDKSDFTLQKNVTDLGYKYN